MNNKLITIILTLIVVLSAISILPSSITWDYNTLKHIVLTTSGVLLFFMLLNNYKYVKIDTKDVLLFLFLGLVFASTCFSDNIKKSIIGEINRFEGLITFIIYGSIYLCSKKIFNYKNINIFVNIMFWLSIFIGLLGISQRYVDLENLSPVFNRGICATFGNSNFYGSYISIILPIAITFFVFRGDKKSFILSLLMFHNMIASGTRSAWVAFAVIALVGLIYLIKQRNKQYYKRVLILVLSFTLIFIYLYTGFGLLQNSTTRIKFNQIKNDFLKATKSGLSNEMGSGRIEIWNMTLKLIAKKPILGCGPDNLMDSLIKYCPYEVLEFVTRTKVLADKAHNEYLQIAATIGIPALIVYLIFISKILLPKLKNIFKDKVSLLLTLTIISYLTQAFFNISTIGVAPLYWMILGLSDNEDVQNKLNKIL